ncbi:MAG: hypothetical protein WKG07_11570 [Hymenobacter sp.]
MQLMVLVQIGVGQRLFEQQDDLRHLGPGDARPDDQKQQAVDDAATQLFEVIKNRGAGTGIEFGHGPRPV